MKRKGHYPSPSTSGGSRHKRFRPYLPSRQRRVYSSFVPSRTLPPQPGAREFGRASTARFNDSIAADVLGGMAAVALSESTGLYLPLANGAVRQARNILSDLAQPTVTQTNMNKGQTQSKKALVTRSAMAVSGKVRVKRVKKVHLSSKFIKGVKQVMAGSQATGSYVVIKQGLVGSIVGAGTQGSLLSTIMGTPATTACVYSGSTVSSGSRTLFNAMSNWSTTVNSTAVADHDFNFFTPAKILDAASVLFNNKALGDPYVSAANLSTTFVGGTGAPVPGVPGQLKINVLGCSVDFQIKNVSNRVVTMDIWECVPSVKFQTVNALQQLINVTTDYLATANTNNVLYFRSQPLGTSSSLFLEQAVDPFVILKKFAGFAMTWKKRSMTLAPDETCIHSIIGPSGVLDFSKLVQPGVTNPIINTLLKGWSCSVVISINGDQVIQPTLAINRGDKAAYSDAVNPRMGMPVSIQTREYYKVAVPEIAGFVTQNGAVGTTQMLNLRKPKCIIWNQVPANGNTSAAPIQVSNEQQPMSDVVGGQTA